MDFVLFMFFSVLETTALLYLMFRLFKFDMYYASIIFISLVLSYFSYTLRAIYHLPVVDVILQFGLTFCFVWLFFKVQVFYAGVMTAVGFTGYWVIQTVYQIILYSFGLFTQLPAYNTLIIYILQIVSCITAFFIGWLVHRKNKGFDFVPHSPYEKVKLSNIKRIILLLFIPVIIYFAIVFFYFNGKSFYIIVIPVILAIILFCLLFWSYGRDRGDD